VVVIYLNVVGASLDIFMTPISHVRTLLSYIHHLLAVCRVIVAFVYFHMVMAIAGF
jgi:hypothetical protein